VGCHWIDKKGLGLIDSFHILSVIGFGRKGRSMLWIIKKGFNEFRSLADFLIIQ